MQGRDKRHSKAQTQIVFNLVVVSQELIVHGSTFLPVTMLIKSENAVHHSSHRLAGRNATPTFNSSFHLQLPCSCITKGPYKMARGFVRDQSLSRTSRSRRWHYGIEVTKPLFYSFMENTSLALPESRGKRSSTQFVKPVWSLSATRMNSHPKQWDFSSKISYFMCEFIKPSQLNREFDRKPPKKR